MVRSWHARERAASTLEATGPAPTCCIGQPGPGAVSGQPGLVLILPERRSRASTARKQTFASERKGNIAPGPAGVHKK